MVGKLCLIFGLAVGTGACGGPVDTSVRDDAITFDSIAVTRVTADASGTWFVDGVLRNRTPYLVNNVHGAAVLAGSARADFDLRSNKGPSVTIGCLSPNPWDVAPGDTKAIRLRLCHRAK